MLTRFGSQVVDIDDKEGFLSTHIETPFFTAGKLLGWKGKSVGIGLSEEIVRYAKEHLYTIVVTVGSNQSKFYLDGEDWYYTCQNNHWTYKVDKEKTVFVMPWFMLKKI